MSLADFQYWNRLLLDRMSANNILTSVPEYEDIVPRYPWWNAHVYLPETITSYVLLTNWGGDSHGRLAVYTVDTKTNVVVFIKSDSFEN